MGLLDILGFGNRSEQLYEFLKEDAVIIDVRTSEEFAAGNIKGSKNIPLDTIPLNTENIKTLNKPIIVCCRSGMRSAKAASILKKNNIKVINGGGWESLNSKL
jgi:phage shock protein E